MKIAIFTDTYLPTVNGVSYAVKSWKEEMESRGHEVDIVCPAPGDSDEDITFRSFEVPLYEGYYAGYIPPLRKDFSDYDVFYLNSFFMIGYYGYRKAKKNDITLVSIVHTPIEEYLDYVTSWKPGKILLKKVYNYWESRILSASSTGVALSDYMEEHIHSLTDECNIVRLSNGVNTEFFRPVETSDFREKYSITGEKIIGFTGRLSSEKRVEELVKFAERFEGEVIIGGDGPCREECERLVEKGNVRFLGFLDREDLPAFYSSIDAFIFPSRAENDPLTVLEANACGTPVIGADAAGLKDSISEGENGYLYSPGDLNDLGEKLEKAYSEIENISDSSLEFARRKSIASTVDDLLELAE